MKARFCLRAYVWRLLRRRTPASSSAPVPSSTKEDIAILGTAQDQRIYVDLLGGACFEELQSMIVSSLVASKRFKVTENPDRADVILKATPWSKLPRRFTPTAQHECGCRRCELR